MARSIRKELQMRGISEDEVREKCTSTNRYSVMREYGFNATTSWNNYCNEIGAPDLNAYSCKQDGNTNLLDQVITKITRLQNQLTEAQDLLKEKDEMIAYLEAKLERQDNIKVELVRKLCKDVVIENKVFNVNDDILALPAEV